MKTSKYFKLLGINSSFGKRKIKNLFLSLSSHQLKQTNSPVSHFKFQKLGSETPRCEREVIMERPKDTET